MKAMLAEVARGMTVSRYADLQGQAERLRACHEREREGTGHGAQVAGEAVGRPEYRSFRNAMRKERLYARWLDAQEQSRRWADGMYARWLEREDRKWARVEAWLDFEPENVPVNLEWMPDF